MSLSLHILGAGGAYPPPSYGGPSLLLEAPDARILLDCGDSCAARLEVLGYSPCEVDAVYVSHRHGDHWSGLVQLLSSRGALGCPVLRVLAEASVAGELAGLLDPLVPGNAEVSMEPVEAAAGLRLGGGVEASLFRVRHQVPTYGVRVHEGSETLIVYTADTAYDRSLAEELRGARIAVVDATLPDREGGRAREWHMTVSEAWTLAVREAGASLAVAFHLSPESLSAARRLRLPGLLVPGELLSIKA